MSDGSQEASIGQVVSTYQFCKPEFVDCVQSRCRCRARKSLTRCTSNWRAGPLGRTPTVAGSPRHCASDPRYTSAGCGPAPAEGRGQSRYDTHRITCVVWCKQQAARRSWQWKSVHRPGPGIAQGFGAFWAMSLRSSDRRGTRELVRLFPRHIQVWGSLSTRHESRLPATNSLPSDLDQE